VLSFSEKSFVMSLNQNKTVNIIIERWKDRDIYKTQAIILVHPTIRG
jgi:hypothetical protein